MTNDARVPTTCIHATPERVWQAIVHLDRRLIDRAAEVSRLIALGATEGATADDGAGTVMTDPEGNEFCEVAVYRRAVPVRRARPSREQGVLSVIDRPEPRHDRMPTAEPVDPLRARWPARIPHEGRFARVEPLEAGPHAAELYAASHGDEPARRLWDYLAYGPFASGAAFGGWLRDCSATADPLFFAVRDRRMGRAGGVASYLNIHPRQGTIEIGHIWFGPDLQNTAAATEALFLLIRHALDDLGYRRLEWKCNALNAASRRAAVRLGFAFEGIFYQHMIAKGRNRDTAWYAILDGEWPRIRANFATWLAPENFDEAGRQRASLSELNRSAR